MGSMASPSSEAAMDMVTPLKKRRLANYKEDTENEEQLMDSLAVGDTSPPVNVTNAVHGSPDVPRHVPNGLGKQILQNLVLEAVLGGAMEDMLSEPAALPESSDEAKAGDDSKEDDQIMEEEEEKVQIKDQEMDTSTTKPAVVVKAPEPNSAFKSFFNSNVSLEALEAEIAASKKQREAVIEIKAEEEIQISSKMPQTSP